MVRYEVRCIDKALMALGAMVAVGTAFADTQPSDGLQEIVVTATKTGETNLQKTPASITAYTAEDIDKAGLTDVHDLVGRTPGLSISQNAAWAEIYIRGVGTSNVFLGTDPSVAIHLDGVYLARPSTAFEDFLDVERIEVLRGPQGTLYGRNSSGGTINIISRQPTDTVDARVRVEVGDYGDFKVGAALSGPIFDDRLTGRISVQQSSHDGYVKQLNPGNSQRNLDNQNVAAIRGMLRYKVTDTVDVQLSADYSNEHDHGMLAEKPFFVDDQGTPVVLPAGFPKPQVISDPFAISTDEDFFFKQKIGGASVKVADKFSDTVTLTSLSAYRFAQTDLGQDSDFTELPGLNSYPFDENQHQLSQEFQLSGVSEQWKWVAGLYFLHEDVTMLANVGLPFAGEGAFGTPDFASTTLGFATTNAYSGFGQATYSLTDHWALTAGARYSYENKSLQSSNQLFLGGVGIPIGPGIGFNQNQEDNWKAWTPKFGIDYTVDDGLMFYLSATRGFKSGGFNFSAQQPAFDPEYIWSYEIGMKSEWFDRRLRANVSAFHYQYSDLQLSAFKISTGQAAEQITFNAANAKINGLEFELSARPIPAFELSATAAFLDAKYGRFITARPNDPNQADPTPVNVTGNELNMAPRSSFTVAGEYEWPISSKGFVSSRLEYVYQSTRYFSEFNDRNYADGPYGLVNARIAYKTTDDRWEYALFGHNLTNTVYYDGAVDFSPFGISKQIMPPRTFGMSVSYHY